MRGITRVCLVAAAIAVAVVSIGAQSTRELEAELRSAQYREQVQGDVPGAVVVYKKLAESPVSTVAASALLALGEAYERAGNAESRATFARILSQHGDTPAAAIARRKLGGVDQRQAGPTQKALITGPDANEIWSPVSPDGRFLPFSHPETGNVAIRDLTTGHVSLLTQSKGYEEGMVEAAVWSPDGRQLVYSWWNNEKAGPGVMELRVIARERGTPKVVFTGKDDTWLQPLGVSPDGHSVLTQVKASAGMQLCLISLADGQVRTLKTSHSAAQAMFSPDGRYVAYDYAQPGVPMRDINIIDIDGKNDRVLVAGPDHEFLLGWFPDGRHVLFASDRLNAPGAWLIAVQNGAADGNPVLVKADIGRASGLGFDKNGRFYSTLSVAGGDVFLAEIDATSGKVTQQSRPAPKSLHLARRSQGAWSRDGRQIAYIQSIEGRGLALVIQTVATGDLMTRPLQLSNIERPSWFPDGSAVAIEASSEANNPTGPRGIFKVDLRTGEVTILAKPGRNFCCLAPDGLSFFFARADSQGPAHWRQTIAGGVEQKVRQGPGAIVISPDGKSLAVWRGGPKGATIAVLPSSGGTERTVIEGIPGSHNKHAWSHDGQHVFYIANRNELWRVPAAGGPGVDTGVRIEIAKHISVNPDGKRLALSGGVAEVEVWMWENLLPRK